MLSTSYWTVNARFTTVPLKPSSNQIYGRYLRAFSRLSSSLLSKKCACHFCRETVNENKHVKENKSRIYNSDLIRQTFKLWITHILWKNPDDALCPRTSKIPSAWVRVLGTTVSLVPWRSIILRGDPGRSPYPSRGDAATGAMDANISLKCGE